MCHVLCLQFILLPPSDKKICIAAPDISRVKVLFDKEHDLKPVLPV